jgi:putative peptidoglycan lipid II flippase
LVVLMLPLVAAVLFSQLGELADNFFASGLGEGGVAARNFARKIVDLPILMVPYTLSVVLYPHFAHLAARGEIGRLYRALSRSVRSLALIFAAITVMIVLLAEPTVTLLLERGAFDARARQLTTWPLRLYGIGLVTFAVEAILVPFYFSLKDTVTPVVAGILGVLVHIALAALLVGPLGVGGVALALTISKTLKVCVLVFLLRRKQTGFRWRPVVGFAVRLLLAAAAAAVGGALFMAFRAPPPAVAGIGAQALWLVTAGLLIAAVFAGVSALVGSPERALIRSGIAWTWGVARRRWS